MDSHDLNTVQNTVDLQKKMVEAGFVSIFGSLIQLTFGNSNMQRLCLHALVRLVSDLTAEGNWSSVQYLATISQPVIDMRLSFTEAIVQLNELLSKDITALLTTRLSNGENLGVGCFIEEV